MFIQASQAIAEVRNPALTNERSQILSDARHMACVFASFGLNSEQPLCHPSYSGSTASSTVLNPVDSNCGGRDRLMELNLHLSGHLVYGDQKTQVVPCLFHRPYLYALSKNVALVCRPRPIRVASAEWKYDSKRQVASIITALT
ncbi:hypothetical protein G6F57_002762 [Rhizopus arrhizus]|uniref:Uncharacterized protein n=1 Tax=Rhizopus oryzae TaxID=64495 RepID=A0A9P6XJ50_RHIOR|nr:hypothetical protein G6F23_005704 [Rhizopus arrhizus]KAG1414508.1 hypothetical protein G6F58_006920 [Rhizopus delemar]KAG0758882.1 hypothetical protein G6F24_009477 [Rhizopus arrhizus]KAG0786142.1 hypothetical protein G6F21_008800 [Rhizopus arrhizus]KAG0798698.1 hypothetical protein G6F22_003965 [Rhizopus arrhizus]